MAQQQDSFLPDEQDSFIPDSFVPDEEKPKRDLSQVGKSLIHGDPDRLKGGLIQQGWDWLNKGLISPETMRAIGNIIVPKYNVLPDFQEKVRDVGADLSSGMTSPLNVGITAATLGTGTAAKLGLTATAKALNTAVKAASVPVAISGASKTFDSDSSLGERALGALEMVGGGLGVKYGSGVNLNRTPKVLPPEVPQIRGLLPAHGETGLGTALDEPRFIAGKLGIADANLDYPIDLKDFAKLRSLSGEGFNSSDLLDMQQRGVSLQTPFPGEIGELGNIPPGLAAEYGTSFGQLAESVPRDIAQQNAMFEALIPNRLRSETDLFSRPVINQGIPRARNIDANILEHPIGGSVVNEPIEQSRMWPSKTNKKLSFEEAVTKAVDNPDNIVEMQGGLGAINPFRNKQGRFISEAEAKTDPNSPVGKLLGALRTARPLRKEQEAIYSAERSKRIKEAMKFSGQGEGSLKKQLGALKGEMEKVEFDSIRGQLNPKEINDLSNTVDASKFLSPYEKINAKIGLGKLLGGFGGNVPTNSELKLLKTVFGKEFADTIVEMQGGLGLVGSNAFKALKNVQDVMTFNKTLMSSYDASAPFRQGIGLVHTKEFWKNISPMIKSMGSEKFFDSTMQAIDEMPSAPLMRRGKLALTDMITAREEAYLSKLAEKVPGIKGSNRGYTAFLNKTRADVFDRLLKDAHNSGIDIDDDVFLGKLGKYINDATGRSSLGKLGEPATDLLNVTLFSPRLIASRIKMLNRAVNPYTYIKEDPFIRKQYLKSVLSMAAFGTGFASLAKMAGAEVSLNPTNSDFGKIKIGDTRLDPWGGFQQFIVYAARMRYNEVTSSKDNKTYPLGTGKFGSSDRWDTSWKFAQSKFNPAVGFIKSVLSQRDFTGQPLNIQQATAKMFVPMIVEDMWALANENPELLPLGVLGAGGMSLQSYEDVPTELITDVMKALGLMEESKGNFRQLGGN